MPVAARSSVTAKESAAASSSLASASATESAGSAAGSASLIVPVAVASATAAPLTGRQRAGQPPLRRILQVGPVMRLDVADHLDITQSAQSPVGYQQAGGVARVARDSELKITHLLVQRRAQSGQVAGPAQYRLELHAGGGRKFDVGAVPKQADPPRANPAKFRTGRTGVRFPGAAAGRD